MSGAPDKAKVRIAKALTEALGCEVSADDLHIVPAAGHWTHAHQDCRRWTGMFRGAYGVFLIGSWGMNLSRIRSGCRFTLHDNRKEHRPYDQFSIEPPEDPHP